MKMNCLECGEPMKGRSDRKFCSNQCRSTYNYAIQGDALRYLKRVNYLLRKNRRILKKLNPEGKAKIHKVRLLDAGFRFDYFTNTYVTRSGKTYYFCYEQGYLPLEGEFYALVRRQPYMER